jgi:hypothetical protein
MSKKIFSVSRLAAAVALAASTSGAVQAGVMVDNDDWNVRWDNTFKYSAIGRTESPDKETADTVPSIADGSLNFKRGSLVSNRIDWRTELDVIFRDNMGFRISGAAWYDDAYTHGTDYEKQADHHAPAAYGNQYSGTQASGEFNEDTEDWYTGTAEIQDAFLFYNFNIGDMGGVVRAGRHTIYYGNSLFGTGVAHSVAGYMTSIDADKALGSPGTEAKELFMPSNKISMELSITDNLNLSMFYGLEYLPQRMPSGGSFFSPVSDLNINPEQGDNTATFQALGPDVRAGIKFVDWDEPDDEGSEYGFSLQYYIQSLDLEAAVHYVNSYSRSVGNLKTDMTCGVSAAEFVGAAGVVGGASAGALVCSNKYIDSLNSAISPLAGALVGVYGAGAVGTNPNGYNLIIGEGTWAVKEDIDVYGLSLSKEWMDISWGMDLTYVQNALLGNTLNNVAPEFPGVLGGTTAGNADNSTATPGLINEDDLAAGLSSLSSTNTQTAEGDVLGLVVNAIGLLNSNDLWDGGSWIVEYTASQLLEVNNRPDTLNFGAHGNGDDANLELNRISSHIQIRFAPTWFQVMPGVDLSVPISIGHGFGDMKSALSNTLDFTVYSVGAKFNFRQKYDIGLTYNNYGGSKSGIGHNLKDRDNIAFTVKATF